MSLSNFPRKLWLQEDSNGASLIFKPLEPNTVLYIQTEAKLTVDFNDWMKEKEYNASAFSLKSRCIADAQELGVPSQAQWFFFFFYLFFSFSFCCPPKPSSYIQFTGLSSCCQRNMTYISPHRSRVCQTRTMKFDSVIHSPFLFIVLVIITSTHTPPLLALIYFVSAFIFTEGSERISPG